MFRTQHLWHEPCETKCSPGWMRPETPEKKGPLDPFPSRKSWVVEKTPLSVVPTFRLV